MDGGAAVEIMGRILVTTGWILGFKVRIRASKISASEATAVVVGDPIKGAFIQCYFINFWFFCVLFFTVFIDFNIWSWGGGGAGPFFFVWVSGSIVLICAWVDDSGVAAEGGGGNCVYCILTRLESLLRNGPRLLKQPVISLLTTLGKNNGMHTFLCFLPTHFLSLTNFCF